MTQLAHYRSAMDLSERYAYQYLTRARLLKAVKTDVGGDEHAARAQLCEFWVSYFRRQGRSIARASLSQTHKILHPPAQRTGRAPRLSRKTRMRRSPVW